MWTRKELKEKAKVVFKANFATSALAAIILTFLSGGGSGSAGTNGVQMDGSETLAPEVILAVLVAILLTVIIVVLIKIFVGNALIVGCQKVFIENERSVGEMPTIRDIIFVFKSRKWKNVSLTMFIKDLTVYVMTLLCIIPGIWMSFNLMMVPYILADNPDIDRREAFRMSREMMNGQKWNTFILQLSFIPWLLVSAITCGIAHALYVGPYMYQTLAELYLELKKGYAYENPSYR